jgi:hypothetical protein
MSASEKTASEKQNVFIFSSTRSRGQELALVAVPVIAIIAAFSLLHTQPARLDDQGKVKLRVMSAVAPPTPELAREAVQGSELIQFALSKVAKVPAAAPSAGEETADDRIILAANNTPAGEHKSAVAPIAP